MDSNVKGTKAGTGYGGHKEYKTGITNAFGVEEVERRFDLWITDASSQPTAEKPNFRQRTGSE